MPTALKYVDPNRPPSSFSRGFASFSNTRMGRFLSAKIVWKVDPYLLRATRGRFGMGLVLPTALLETRGAKSGKLRRNGVIYFHDGDLVTIIASKQGDRRHPAWFHNLQAHPDVRCGGTPMRATVVTDESELAGCGRSPTVSSRRTRHTVETRPRQTGRPRSPSSTSASQAPRGSRCPRPGRRGNHPIPR